MSAFYQHPAGVIQQCWTTQDGVRRGIIKDRVGKHHTVMLPFGSEEGDRVNLVDGTWRASVRAA